MYIAFYTPCTIQHQNLCSLSNLHAVLHAKQKSYSLTSTHSLSEKSQTLPSLGIPDIHLYLLHCCMGSYMIYGRTHLHSKGIEKHEGIPCSTLKADTLHSLILVPVEQVSHALLQCPLAWCFDNVDKHCSFFSTIACEVFSQE